MLMFLEIIEQLEINQLQRTVYANMAKVYENHLPDSLYLNHYELAEHFGHSHESWNKFLKIKEVDRLIESEIAQIAEIGARQALQRLQSGNAQSSDIQAAKEILSNSKLL